MISCLLPSLRSNKNDKNKHLVLVPFEIHHHVKNNDSKPFNLFEFELFDNNYETFFFHTRTVTFPLLLLIVFLVDGGARCLHKGYDSSEAFLNHSNVMPSCLHANKKQQATNKQTTTTKKRDLRDT